MHAEPVPVAAASGGSPRSGFSGLLQAPLPGAGSGSLGATGVFDGGAWQCTIWHPGTPLASLHVDGAQAVAFHGEIHNAEALRAELAMPPQASVAQLLLQGWRRWSMALLPRLDGVYALALREGDSLLLHRDPSGLRDLHYAIADGRLLFATHLDTLMRMPGMVRGIARPALHEYLRLLDIAAPSTLYRGVRTVEEGCALQWRPGQASPTLVPQQAPGEASPDNFEQAVDRLDGLLHESIRARLADVARPAAFLSGGVDSALLCAIAARQRPDLVAVTVGFDESAYDESPVARDIAAHVGLRHEVLRFDRTAHLQALARLGVVMEQPMADPSTPSTLLAFEHCREHFDGILDGTGADEALGLMPPRHTRLAVAWCSLLPPAARRGLLRVVRSCPPLAGFDRMLDFDHAAELLVRWGGFRTGEIAALCGEPVSFAHTRFWQTFERHPRTAHFERYSALIDAMPCGRLNQALQATAAPVRFPFCHSQTNRFLRQLHTDFRSLPGQPKRILRALLARYVPPAIWASPKRGFTFPLQDFLAGEHHALVRQHLAAERWQGQSWLAPEAVASVGRRFVAGERGLLFRVWALVVLSVWLEGHGELPTRPNRPLDD